MRYLSLLTIGVSLMTVAPSASANPAETSDDPFVWMEEIEGARAIAWVKKQNEQSLKIIKSDPFYEKALDAATAILTAKDRIPYIYIENGYAYNFWQDDVHVRGIWRRTTPRDYESAEPKWETVLDVDRLAETEKENWVWKGAQCLPPKFNKCLVTLSRGGGDASVVREFDMGSKSFVKDGFELSEAKSSIAWVDDNTVFVGTDWGKDSLTTSGYPRLVKIWKRGHKLEQAQLVFEGQSADVAASGLAAFDPDGPTERFIIRTVGFFDNELSYMSAAGKIVPIPVPTYASWVGLHKRQMLFKMLKDWTNGGETYRQGSLIAFSLDDFVKRNALPKITLVIAPDERSSIEGVSTNRDAVFVSMLSNVKGKLLQLSFDNGSWSQQAVTLPDNGAVAIVTASDFDPTVMATYTSFLVPDQLYTLKAGSAPRVIKQLPARFAAEGYEVKQFEATSKDGTKIPYFIVRKGGTPLDGTTPTVVYAYGGFEVSTTPWYWSSAGKLWLENGGAYVIANIRGGGEFGPRWHEAARLENHQRNFDDLAAVSRDVIARGFTSSRRLGALGGSQGGLLVAGTFVQNPDLFNAVACQVPLGDMIAYTHMGAGASWIAEYGDPADPKMRAIIAKWSPYQNIKKGVKYPKVFFVTSTKDDRVHPGHARKMAAKMEANGQPYLYYENIEGGHAAASNLQQRAEQLAMTYTYLRQQLMGSEVKAGP
jgi:prolyl oligopeptidase